MNNYFYNQTSIRLKMVMPISIGCGLGTYPNHELKPNFFLLSLGYGQQQS